MWSVPTEAAPAWQGKWGFYGFPSKACNTPPAQWATARERGAPALREFSERLATPWHRLQKRHRLK